MVRWAVIIPALVFFLVGNYNLNDIKEAVIYYGTKMFPSEPSIGGLLFVVAIFVAIFTTDIFVLFKNMFKNIKIKKKWK